MKEPYLYIIESLVCSGLFLGFYRLLIMKATGFRANRIFLLLAMMGACAIPLLQIPVWTVQEPIVDFLMQESVEGVTDGISRTESSDFHWGLMIYGLGVTIMLFRMFMPLFQAKSLRRKEKVMLQGSYFLVISKNIKDAFSSFRTIYLPMIDDKEEERMVIAHEESHLRHFHIFERWTMEVLKAFCWFNPFVWIASRYLVESQEQEVDADVLHQGFDLTEYRKMLLKYALGGEREWICAFSSHSMKRRLLAMTEHRKMQNARIWLIVPMLVLALVCFGFTVKPVHSPEEVTTESKFVISGKVVDELTGLPIMGAVVMETASTRGTVTDKKGEFRLKTGKDKELKFVMIDYETKIFRVDELGESVEIRLAQIKK